MQVHFFHPLCHEHAQGLHRIAPGKPIDADVMAPLIGKAFHKDTVCFGQFGTLALQPQPFGGVNGQIRPIGLVEHAQDALGKLGGIGEFGSHEGRDFRGFVGAARDNDRHFLQVFVADNLPADQKGIAGGKRCGKGFLDLAKRFEIAFHPHFQRVGVLNGADIHPDTLCRARVAQLPLAIRGLQQAFPFIICAQGISASGAEIEAVVKTRARQAAIGTDGLDLPIKPVGVKRAGTSRNEDMLAKHITRTGALGLAIKVMVPDGLQSGNAFDHLKSVGRHKKRL